jgi:hypothetical protein
MIHQHFYKGIIYMSIIKIARSLQVTAAASSFLSADGLLNYENLAKLQATIQATLKALQKQDKDFKVVRSFVVSVKAKPTKYSAASAKKDDLKYQLRRAVKVAERKNLNEKSLAKVRAILTCIEGPDVPKSLSSKIKDAEKAIQTHLKKIDKVKETVGKKREKIRDANNKEFDKAVKELRKFLADSGVKDNQIVESKGIGGRSILVKLGSNFFSIGRADAARFSAARKAASAGE